MPTFYNEVDRHAVDWLKNLAHAGHIAPGHVDARSIHDIQPVDLDGYAQAHFFAGIGTWSYALRLAGWPDDVPVWTGSCPCQPFSDAGQQRGTADDRHLWPAWFKLIHECRPAVIFSEQVASKAALAWFDTVCADLEGEGYTVRAADLCAASVGAPHIRSRLYFVAVAGERGCEVIRRARLHDQGARRDDAAGRSAAVGVGPVADTDSRAGRQGRRVGGLADTERDLRGQRAGRLDSTHRRPTVEPDRHSAARSLGDTSGAGLPRRARERGDDGEELATTQRASGDADRLADTISERVRDQGRGTDEGAPRGVQGEGIQRERLRSDAGDADSGGGFWDDAEWLPCLDGKARPVEPGTSPLADWSTEGMGRSRSGLLKGYGNAIVAPLAAAFIAAAIDAITDSGYGAGADNVNDSVTAQVDLEPVEPGGTT